MRKLDTIVIHCSATPPEVNWRAADVRRSHMDPKRPGGSFNDIGYHRVICRDGAIEAGRALNVPGAHAAGHNARSIGICMIGGVRRTSRKDKTGKPVLEAEDNFTPEQWDALKQEVRALLMRFPAITKVVGHRDLNAGKDCPSFSVRDWVQREGILAPAAWNTGAADPKPLAASRQVQGATLGGIGGTGLGIATLADQAQEVSWLAEPGSWLALALIALVIGGTIYTIVGRLRQRKESGV